MQRWIVVTAIALAVLVLAVAGGAYASWSKRQVMPTRVYVPLPLNPELTEELRDQAADNIRRQIEQPPVLVNVARSSGLATALDLPNDEAAAEFLRERLFVDVGETATTMGVAPALEIGFRCKVREFKDVSAAATDLMKEVWKIVNPEAQPPPQIAPAAY
jgi:hypothetical protein